MDIVSSIGQWSAEFLEESVFVVNVESKQGSRKIIVYIDGDQPVNIEQCRALSRYLSGKLDEMDYGDEAYQLEVSTPGTDKPLRLPRQYTKHKGRELMVKLNAGTELTGRLEEIADQGIALLLKDKKKGYPKDGLPKQIGFADIAEAKVLISFR